MKKLISLLLATLLILSLAGCGASGGSESPASTAAASGGGSSSAFPSNTITIYCGYSAGGGSDVICRIMAEQLSRKLGVNVIVEDVTGSGGWVLWTQILENTAADGYSISLVNTPNYNLGAYDLANPRKYHYDDLDLLCNWVSDYNAIAIRSDETRYTDWDGFVE
ncbi:MAG: tripartite tricarboxylate transporter substrate-binding protein, partial [Bacteroidales bacterium]|nr:tripartite tricarboxylate transporter substrate-binding protein [Bacteroidales bacterium]